MQADKLPELNEDMKKTYAYAYTSLAEELISTGKIDEGVEKYKKAMQVHKRLFGQGHQLLVESKIKFADMLFTMDIRPDFQYQLYSQSLDMKSMIFGMKDESVLKLRVFKIEAFAKLERISMAIQQVQQLIADCVEVLPQNHTTRLYSEALLGYISFEKLEFQNARDIFKGLMDRTKASDDPNTIQFYQMIVGRYAQCLITCGSNIQSQKDIVQAIERMQKTKVPETPQLLNLKTVHGIILQKMGYLEKALQQFQYIRDIQIKSEGIKTISYQNTQMMIANCLTDLNRLDQAAEKNALLIENIRKFNPMYTHFLNRVKLNLGVVLFAQGKAKEAKEIAFQVKKFVDQNNIPSNDILYVMVMDVIENLLK